MLEDHVRAIDPSMIHGDVLAGDAVVCVLGREPVAEVIAVVDVVGEVGNVTEDAVMLAELMIDAYIHAVVVVGVRGVGKEVIQIAAAGSRSGLASDRDSPTPGRSG